MNKAIRAGKVGNYASITCLVHCIAVPVILCLAPSLGLAWMESDLFEFSMLAIAVGFSMLSLCWGYRSHKKFRAFALLAAGAMWFYIAHISHHHWMSVFGGLCMIGGNLLNHRLCKSCGHCCDGNHSTQNVEDIYNSRSVEKAVG